MYGCVAALSLFSFSLMNCFNVSLQIWNATEWCTTNSTSCTFFIMTCYGVMGWNWHLGAIHVVIIDAIGTRARGRSWNWISWIFRSWFSLMNTFNVAFEICLAREWSTTDGTLCFLSLMNGLNVSFQICFACKGCTALWTLGAFSFMNCFNVAL